MRVEAQQSEERGMNIGYVVGILDRMESEFVRAAVHGAVFDSGTKPRSRLAAPFPIRREMEYERE